MKSYNKIHSASVYAFIEYLKKSSYISQDDLIKRMFYNIGWPVETIAYVIHTLVEVGYYPPKDVNNSG